MPRPLALLLGALLLAGAYFALLFFAQRALLFPKPRVRLPAVPLGGELVEVPHASGTAAAILLEPTSGSSGPAPLIVFLHGNGELADFWIHEFSEPRAWGWAVLLAEYPGYGRAAGSPSESSITSAVLALYDWARKDPRFDANRVVSYGRSVGGAAAARLAAERPVAALILESSFTGVRPFASRFLAPTFLVRDPFDSIEALSSYRGPMLVLHGRDDTIIPPDHGRALAAAVPDAEYEELPCGHNDCPRSWSRIGRFLRVHGLLDSR